VRAQNICVGTRIDRRLLKRLDGSGKNEFFVRLLLLWMNDRNTRNRQALGLSRQRLLLAELACNRDCAGDQQDDDKSADYPACFSARAVAWRFVRSLLFSIRGKTDALGITHVVL